MVDSRHIDKLSSYFSKIILKIQSNVKYIIIDMYDTYLRLAKIYFANATIVVDSFHVLQNLRKAFDKIRNKFIRKFDNGADTLDDNSENYYLLKKGTSLLYKIYGNLNQRQVYNRKLGMYISDRSFVDLILKIDPEIDKVYQLMQDYLEFNYKNSYEKAQSEIDHIIENFYELKISSFVEFSKTLSTWKEYVLNSFTTIYDEVKHKKRRLSDSPIEGLNNLIEKIHNNGNEFTSFGRFKKIVLYKINRYLPYRFK